MRLREKGCWKAKQRPPTPARRSLLSPPNNRTVRTVRTVRGVGSLRTLRTRRTPTTATTRTAQLLLWNYKTRQTSTPLVDQDKFNKAIAYAISRDYFRDPSTPDINQSTDEDGLITVRTPGRATVAEFQTDGDTFQGIGNLSTKSSITQCSTSEEKAVARKRLR